MEPLVTAPVVSLHDQRQRRMLTSAKIVERMLNLNTFGELARDYRFYEDPADEYKDGEGTLLPLWTFKGRLRKKIEFSLSWRPPPPSH